MKFSTQKVTEKLVYTGATSIILPFAYGIGLLCIQAIEGDYVVNTYKVTPSLFFAMTYFILFIGGAISNFIIYSFPKGRIATFISLASSCLASIAVKTYYAKTVESLFYCDSMIALTGASLLFVAMVVICSGYSTNLETRVALSIASICFAFSFGLFNIPQNVLCVLASRVFVGFAAGVISKYIPCYLSLISPIEKRGIFSSLYSLGLVGGLLSFNAFLPWFKAFFVAGSWFLPLFFLLYPSLLFFCIPLHIKDSYNNTLYSLLRHPSALKSLLFVSAFHIATNLCGINQLALNPQSIFGDNYAFHSAFTLFISLIVSFFAGYLMETFGRKNVTLISCMFLIAGCISFYFRIAVITMAYIYSIGFNLGMASVPFVILGEIFPEDFISPGAYFGTQCNWIGSAISTIIPQGDVSAPYNSSFVVYLISTVAFATAIHCFFRETKGLTPRFQ